MEPLQAFVKRKNDRGHRLVKFYIDWSGLPPFAQQAVGVHLFFLLLDELVWETTDPIAECYVFDAKVELQRFVDGL